MEPLQYIYKALNTRLTPVPAQHPAYQLVDRFRNAGDSKSDVFSLFSLERKGELERYDSFVAEHSLGNKKMLWHGSGMHNFLSILTQGLKVAPEGV